MTNEAPMLDLNTLKLLGHQATRRRYWLTPPRTDEHEAELCMRRIDDILDRRPRPTGQVAPDGEELLSDQSSWVQTQVSPVPFLEAEPSASDGMPRPGGGVGVMDRPPNDPAECLSPEGETEVRKWRRQLDGL